MAGDDPSDSATRDAADDLIGKAIGAVPKDSELARVLKQVGWLGLILSVLIGNVPLSALVKATASGKATLNLDAVDTYISVFVLLTPFVALFGIATLLVLTDNLPEMPGWAYLVVIGLLWWGATLLSLAFGGAAPITSVVGPTSGSPSGFGAYVLDSIGDYVAFYGPIPVLAGPVLGAALGYWVSLLEKN